MKKITKLVLPVAGMGKRLLPLTKKTPKNLVKVNGRPLLEYVLEEAVQSGIREVVLIASPKHKKQFAVYLTKNRKKFPSLAFHIRIQETPGGNGHAIAQAADVIGGEPFAVRFCDDVILSDPPVLKTMIAIATKRRASVLLLERVPMKMVNRFGVVGFKHEKQGLCEVTKIVEKPKVKDAPSNLTIVGGYVLMPNILRNLRLIADTLPIIADDALPLAVALQMELILKGKIWGFEFKGRRLDCGTFEKLREAEMILRG